MLQRLIIKGYDSAFLVVQSDHCPRDSKLPNLEYIRDKTLSLTYSQDRVSSRNKVHQSKMKEMIETITASHFMLPLTQIDPDINDKIKRSLQSTDYKDEKHVFNDLTALISYDDKQMNLTLDVLLGDETETRRIVFNREDIKISVQEIITKISSIALAVSFEEQLRQNPLSTRIFKALKDRFPNVSKETLKAGRARSPFAKMKKIGRGWSRSSSRRTKTTQKELFSKSTHSFLLGKQSSEVTNWFTNTSQHFISTECCPSGVCPMLSSRFHCAR